MAKMTLSGLSSAIATYVAAAKIAGSWSATTNNLLGALDKIGKMVTIDGDFTDILTELDGDNLELGKTIEEYFIDLTLPSGWSGNLTTEGAKDVVPALPSVENCAYSYTLGRDKVKTTLPYDNYERACIDATEAGNIGAKILGRLNDSYQMVRYQAKKQLIGRFSDATYAVNKEQIAQPTDTATGEAFIKAVKKDIEDASFPNEKSITSGALIGRSRDLVLYIKKGIMPSVEVDTLAGAFNKEFLALGTNVKIVVLDDFGAQTNTKVYAMLCDARSMKLHNGYDAMREGSNADGDFVNIVRHYELTAFYSKYTFSKVYYNA